MLADTGRRGPERLLALLAEEAEVDPLAGNAVLNGIPVEVEPAATGT